VTLCAFIGDEISAAGFRLAGVEVHVPDPADAPGLFQRLSGEAKLIVLTAEAAAWIPETALRRAWAADRPLVLIVSDVRGRSHPPDVGASLRRQLGMAE